MSRSMWALNILLVYAFLSCVRPLYFVTMQNDSDIGAVGGDDLDENMDETVQYSVETNNAFSALGDNARVGNSDMDKSNNNPTKRKRFSTGNIHRDPNFESMSQDDKMSAMFAKLSKIEDSQDELKAMQSTMQSRVNTTATRLERSINNVDINTYRNQLLTYKYLDLETRYRDKNIIIYGLEEQEREGVRISTLVREFLSVQLGLTDDLDLYLIYARRLGSVENGRRRVRKRPILCTFSHYSEVDLVMNETRRLKDTGYAIDRDYPPEIAAARKKLWPEVKQRRSTASSSDSIQLKFPAKIVVNGRVVRDEFPHWQDALKSNVDADFRYILQEDMQRASAGFPVASQTQNNGVPSTSASGELSNIGSRITRTPAVFPRLSSADSVIFRIPEIPPPPLSYPPLPPPHSLLLPSGLPQAVNPSMGQLPRQPRPQSPYMAGRWDNVAVNPTVTPSVVNESQQSQLSPSLLSGYSQQNTSVNNENINNMNTNSTTPSLSHNTQRSSRSVSRNSTVARDRSQSVDKQGARGRPQTKSKDNTHQPRSRSRSVNSRSNSKPPVPNVSISGAGQAGPGPGPGPSEQMHNA